MKPKPNLLSPSSMRRNDSFRLLPIHPPIAQSQAMPSPLSATPKSWPFVPAVENQNNSLRLIPRRAQCLAQTRAQFKSLSSIVRTARRCITPKKSVISSLASPAKKEKRTSQSLSPKAKTRRVRTNAPVATPPRQRFMSPTMLKKTQTLTAGRWTVPARSTLTPIEMRSLNIVFWIPQWMIPGRLAVSQVT